MDLDALIRIGCHLPVTAQGAKLYGFPILVPSQLVSSRLGRPETQAFDWPASQDVLIEDYFRLIPSDVRVPDVLGVNDQVWTMAALIQATGVIDADPFFQSRLCDGLFQV